MRLDLTLAQKGLILVSVPLLFELIFVLTLAGLLQQAEREVERATRSKEIIGTTNDLVHNIYAASEIVRYFEFGRDELQDKAFSDIIDNITSEVGTLKRLVADNSGEGAVMTRVGRATDQAVAVLSEGRRAAVEGSILEAENVFRHAKRRLEPVIKGLASDLLTLIDEEKRVEAQMPALQADSRRKVQALLGIGIVLNILLAIFLALYFNSGTARRLQLLMDNTRRLAGGQPLNPLMSGHDEIAHLDRVFNDMASALAAAARKERAIVENALDVICSLDASGLFTALSPASLRLFGFAPEELIGQSHLMLVVESDRAATSRMLQEILGGSGVGSFENRIERKDGVVVDVLWSVQWSEIEQSIFCVAHNITERKEVERMKQELVAMVSHDLRTPLTSIQAYLSLLGTGMYGCLTDSGTEGLQISENSIARLIRLINDLLDIEKMESGKLQMKFADVALGSVIARSVEEVSGFAQSQDVSLVVEPTDAHVFADGERLVQVLVNLISNAAKFSARGKSVLIRTERQEGFVQVSVCDQGRGIPPQWRQAIFERFKQVEVADGSKKGGSGLGLAICKAIVEGHGGKIGVESQEGSGSTFWFRLRTPDESSMTGEPASTEDPLTSTTFETAG